LQSLYHRFPTLKNFKLQIEEKKQAFPLHHREVLVQQLTKQYANTDASSATLQHIQQLENNNTFTVVTGHQLNLFTGPLYFLYKIISTINLCKELKATYSEYN